MKIEDLIKLIDAGYTKEDIEKMNAPAPETTPEPEPAPAPEPAAAPAPEPDNTAAMLQELRDLKKAVYAMNLMSSDIPASRSVDDILSEAMKGGK